MQHRGRQRSGERHRRENKTKEWKERAIKEVWHDYSRRCRLRGIDLELSYEEFKKLILKSCTYCGAPPSNTKRRRDWGPGQLKYNGLDRKDNLLGYTADNCVPCCTQCNQVKTNILSFDEMRKAMAAVLKERAKKARAGS